jgi:hypothetical protein
MLLQAFLLFWKIPSDIQVEDLKENINESNGEVKDVKLHNCSMSIYVSDKCVLNKLIFQIETFSPQTFTSNFMKYKMKLVAWCLIWLKVTVVCKLQVSKSSRHTYSPVTFKQLKDINDTQNERRSYGRLQNTAYVYLLFLFLLEVIKRWKPSLVRAT